MTYKILYIEDLNPDSIVEELEKDGEFEVAIWNPDNIEKINDYTSDKKLVVMDFRLTHSESNHDGTSITQALRTKHSSSLSDLQFNPLRI